MEKQKTDSEERHAVLLRLPKEMHQELRSLAKSNSKTLSAEIIHRLQDGLNPLPDRNQLGSIYGEASPGHMPTGFETDPYIRADLILGNCIFEYKAEVKHLAQLISIRTDFISDLESIRRQGLPKKDTLQRDEKSCEQNQKSVSFGEMQLKMMANEMQETDNENPGLGSDKRRIRTVLKAIHNIRLRAEDDWKEYMNLVKILS